ncbi:MAG: hypothetical protein AB1497_06310 [Bacillota bacterium]
MLDFADLGGGRRDSDAAQQAKNVDALLLVLGAFAKNALSDLDEVSSELILSDLEQVERALKRIGGKRFSSEGEVTALRQAKSLLEDGQFIAGSIPALPTGYNFITDKPAIVALNVPEDKLSDCRDAYALAMQRCGTLGMPSVCFSAHIEMDIARMELKKERTQFMHEYGLNQPGIDRLARTTYSKLGLISFFTVGQDEVRA